MMARNDFRAYESSVERVKLLWLKLIKEEEYQVFARRESRLIWMNTKKIVFML